jgi:thiol-disulfide isomerase/thioredoxin
MMKQGSQMNQAALDAASMGITQDAVLRNVNRDLEKAIEQERLGQEVTALHLEHTDEAYDEAHEKKKEGDEIDDIDFDELDDDPALRALEARRVAQMKAAYAKKAANEAKGHGELRDIVEEEFLKECCVSDRVVVHFYHADFERCARVPPRCPAARRAPRAVPRARSNRRPVVRARRPPPRSCKIMDKHLREIAKRYTSAKFVRIDAEKTPFFVGKLQIRMLPTVLIFHDGVNKDRIVGFDELGGEDDFATRALEVRLHTAGAIFIKPLKKSSKTSALGFVHRGTYSDSDDSDAPPGDDDSDDE